MDGLLFIISTLEKSKPHCDKSCWAVIQTFVSIYCQFMSPFCRSTIHCSFNMFHSRTLARLEKHSNDNCHSEGGGVFFPLPPHSVFLKNTCAGSCAHQFVFQKWTWSVQYLLIYTFAAFFTAMHASLPRHLFIKTSTMNI